MMPRKIAFILEQPKVPSMNGKEMPALIMLSFMMDQLEVYNGPMDFCFLQEAEISSLLFLKTCKLSSNSISHLTLYLWISSTANIWLQPSVGKF